MAGCLASGMYSAVHTTLCSVEQLPYQAVMQLVKMLLGSAAVEPFEDLWTHAKSFQSPEGEKVLIVRW